MPTGISSTRLQSRCGIERTRRAFYILGLTEEQIAEFGLTFGLGGFMLYMLFIIWNLAKESKARRLGTLVLFFVLAFGMLGFIAKTILAWFLEN